MLQISRDIILFSRFFSQTKNDLKVISANDVEGVGADHHCGTPHSHHGENKPQSVAQADKQRNLEDSAASMSLMIEKLDEVQESSIEHLIVEDETEHTEPQRVHNISPDRVGHSDKKVARNTKSAPAIPHVDHETV